MKNHKHPPKTPNNLWLGHERILKYLVKDDVLNVVLDSSGPNVLVKRL